MLREMNSVDIVQVSRMRSRAFTLIEAIISFAILLAAFAVIFGLYHSALRYSSTAENRGKAVLLAQTYMARIRAQALDVDLFLDGLPSYQSSQFTEGQFQVQTRVQPLASGLHSPSFSLEKAADSGDRRILTGAGLQAEVEVTWSGGTGSRSFKAVSLVAEPPRIVGQLNITPSSSSVLSQDQEVTFEVVATDRDRSEVIESLVFEWVVIPGSSRGRIESFQGHGRSVVFKHRLPDIPNSFGTFGAPGFCTLKVFTRCEGVVSEAEVSIELL